MKKIDDIEAKRKARKPTARQYDRVHDTSKRRPGGFSAPSDSSIALGDAGIPTSPEQLAKSRRAEERRLMEEYAENPTIENKARHLAADDSANRAEVSVLTGVDIAHDPPSKKPYAKHHPGRNPLAAFSDKELAQIAEDYSLYMKIRDMFGPQDVESEIKRRKKKR